MTSERSDFLQIFIRANTAMKVPRPHVYFLRGIYWNGKFRRKVFSIVALHTVEMYILLWLSVYYQLQHSCKVVRVKNMAHKILKIVSRTAALVLCIMMQFFLWFCRIIVHYLDLNGSLCARDKQTRALLVVPKYRRSQTNLSDLGNLVRVLGWIL